MNFLNRSHRQVEGGQGLPPSTLIDFDPVRVPLFVPPPLAATLLIPILLSSLLLLLGCAPNEDQILFEQQSMAPPANFTKTNERGIVQTEDPDDWRIGPMFYRLVTVNPIYPNPTTGDDMRIQVYVERTDGLYGLEVYRYNPTGTPRYIQLYRNSQAPLPPGIINIVIPFHVMFPEYPNLDVRGLHRILVYDNRENLITYGDVKLE